MPPRIPFASALRQGLSQLKPSSAHASLSTTAAQRAVRHDVSRGASLLSSLEGEPDPNANPTQSAHDIFKKFSARRRDRGVTKEGRQRVASDIVDDRRHNDFMRQLPRRWMTGDVYAPHDLSPSEMAKWRRSRRRDQDIVDLLGLRPLDMYRNFAFVSEFVTPHGRIKGAKDTGLSPVNQRKVAKAIRRAIGTGLHPSVHRHPEMMIRGPDRAVLLPNIPTPASARDAGRSSYSRI
ncbi:ribosomal protein S18 [Xylariaceae sp. FL1272]|nr:ribosomal protein S18 [Xylariaceae sp. FL1272]